MSVKKNPGQTMLDLATRRKICEDTISRSEEITSQTSNATLSSTFIRTQLPPLAKSHPFPHLQRKPTRVHNSDSFALARELLTTDPSKAGKVGVLNLASDEYPAGGWRFTLSTTQEEALCYSSTLYSTLKSEWYPWPNTGPGSSAGIFSPGVVVFKDTLDKGCVDLAEEERFVVSVITVAAPCWPDLTGDKMDFKKESDLHDLRDKIRLVLRLAAGNGVTSLVLGAMGCGAYKCPPGLVAREMKGIIGEDEFVGWFEDLDFAIYAKGEVGQRNLEAFEREFGGLE